MRCCNLPRSGGRYTCTAPTGREHVAVGRPEVIDEPWFATGSGRAQHADELDEAVGAWIGQRSRDEVIDAFDRAQAAIAPVYDARDIMADPQFQALGTIHSIVDDDLGEMRMQGPLFRLSEDGPTIAFTGRAPGADTDSVLAELGYTTDQIEALRAQGAIA